MLVMMLLVLATMTIMMVGTVIEATKRTVITVIALH